MTVDDFMARLTPVFSTCVSVSLKETLKAVLHPLINIQKEDRTKCREKLIEQRLICDRLDAQNRQSNVLVIGQEEPSSNFTSNGFESQDDFGNVLENIANKVSTPVSTQDIDYAHRLGKKPSGPSGTPRPILFKLTRRSKKIDLMRKKKLLRESHNIKIAEDITPLRKALCDFVNYSDTVKVAYHIRTYIE